MVLGTMTTRHEHWIGEDTVANRRTLGLALLWGAVPFVATAGVIATGKIVEGLLFGVLFAVVATLGSIAILAFVAGGTLGTIGVEGTHLVVGPAGPRIDLRTPIASELVVSRTVLRPMRSQAWGPPTAMAFADAYAFVALRVRFGATGSVVTFRATRVATSTRLPPIAAVVPRTPPSGTTIHVGEQTLLWIAALLRAG